MQKNARVDWSLAASLMQATFSAGLGLVSLAVARLLNLTRLLSLARLQCVSIAILVDPYQRKLQAFGVAFHEDRALSKIRGGPLDNELAEALQEKYLAIFVNSSLSSVSSMATSGLS